jgi:diguanylate cyclase (GGDEF)-like protein/PAS domain S-box-containing protein
MSELDHLDFSVLRPVLDALDEPVRVVDADLRILYWNAAAERLTGHRAAEVVGRACAGNVLEHVDDRDLALCSADCPLRQCLADRVSRNGQLYLLHKSGHRVPVEMLVVPLVRDDRVLGAVELFRPASAASMNRRELVEVRRLAFEDPLTGLSNRRFAEQELQSRLRELEARGDPLSVLMVDLDGFKRINDDHGHAFGDAALKVVSDTLAAGIRAPDVVARWGGDEFMVLLYSATEPDVVNVASRLRVLVRHCRVALPHGTARVTASIGATIASPDDTIATLADRADRLMYASKHQGGDRISFEPAPEARGSSESGDPPPPSGRPTLDAL